MGANLGDPEATFTKALRWMEANPMVVVEAVSSFRETPPMGPPQPNYLNAAVRIRTSLVPCELLELLRGYDEAAGRVRREHRGPRTLDLDLLFVEDLVLQSEELTIPHPGVALRRFVLEPLCELDPDFRHPVLDRALSDLLEALPA